MIFMCLTLIYVFAQVLTIVFSRYVFPLNSDNFSVETFFPTVALLLIFPSSELFYHLIFRDISLNSQETFALFSVIFNLIFSGFCLF